MGRWLVWGNTPNDMFFHGFEFLARFLDVERLQDHQNSEMNRFWDNLCQENWSKNPKFENIFSIRVFPHTNGYIKLLCSQYCVSSPPEFLEKKHNLLTAKFRGSKLTKPLKSSKQWKTHWKIENFQIFKSCSGGLRRRLERILGHQKGFWAL